MLKLRLILDQRRVKPGQPAPIKLRISQGSSQEYMSTGHAAIPSQWNAEAQAVFGRPDSHVVNLSLGLKKTEASQLLLRLLAAGGQEPSPRELKAMLSPKPAQKPKGGFAKAWEDFCATKKGRTAEIYAETWKRISEHCQDPQALGFDDIDRRWLQAFDSALSDKCPSRNGRNIHLRNIRAVFNYAIDEELTTLYPFRKFKIRAEETRKRALPVEDLRRLFSCELVEPYDYYVDYFKLMFALIGINAVDLLSLSPSDAQFGRVEYRRSKTGRLYSIKLEPEAEEIIARHRGLERLLDAGERCADYRDFTKRMNMQLKKAGPCEIGKQGSRVFHPLCPQLSTYWARHSWATIAASLDIPKETISAALGHDIGSKVTSIYIDFDRRKVDEANRRVLDWVFYGKK